MCSWVLDTHQDAGSVSVRFVFNEFETECGWDHFYIHDGDSVFSPLLAAYSGLLLTEEERSSFEFNIRLSGRYCYLHFYSDAAYTMDGFNMSYWVGGCPLNCSEQGLCVDGVCRCEAGRTGSGCEVDLTQCPHNCSQHGLCLSGHCACHQGYRGEDCSLMEKDISWERVPTKDPPSGRASHVSMLQGDLMWVVGGYSLSYTQANTLLTYNLSDSTWSAVPEVGTGEHPWPLYAHSAVFFEGKLYVYGGVRKGEVMDELWVFDPATSNWTHLATASSGYPVSGHTAHVVGRTMLVFFGYSPKFGYMNRVQQFDFDTGEWSLVETTGSIVQGGYGHASAYDVVEGKIYVFGGYHSHSDSASSSSSTYNLTDKLYVFDLETKEWLLLLSSGHPRYLHAMVVQGEYLLLFGGNTHNDTSKSHGTKCFSTDLMLYDIKCNTWHNLTTPPLKDSARYGHSMVTYKGDLYVFGGFSSLMLNDVLRIELGDCSGISNDTECAAAVPGMRCVWDNGKCQRRENSSSAQDVCDAGEWSVCPGYNTCTSCQLAACTWCGDRCTAHNCTAQEETVNAGSNSTEECSVEEEAETAGCQLYHTCHACQDDQRCIWEQTSCKFRTGAAAANVTANKTELLAVCVKKPCAGHRDCQPCAQSNCMWCSNLALCIDTNAYVASFPYGQCMDWTTKISKCNTTKCSGRRSCKECLANSRCGWCSGERDDGLGVCMDGGMAGSMLKVEGVSNAYGGGLQQLQCPADRWFFTQCPLCQCNGHSTCEANSSVCKNCAFPTQGGRCESCQHFYYGSPVNGGNCSQCQCHGQADSCNHADGQCYCHTRGVKGTHCDRCDDVHKYFGDPKNGGTCYYRLSTDFQYTFNLSKKEDANYTQINFLSIPSSGDRDVDFTLNCSGAALINITFKANNQAEEQVITSSHECDYYRTKFEHKTYDFGGDSNSTFFVYVYHFKTPFWLQISFAQPRQLDLLIFFIVFFGCFLSLLLIAATLWKIKHKYDSYRRRQQLMVEMQQMASRPFSSVCVEVERKGEAGAGGGGGGPPERKELRDHVDTALRRRKKLANKPSAVAIEPLVGSKAAVLTLLVQLPFGDSEFAPSGQSGMAVASALVSMGTTRKQSLEHIKGDKPKIRKNLLHMHPDTMA
ncbi:attractin-like protein 1 isoform X2 [Babylonia areolata]|uniref:attractin-like protein 1 isoform X2 n=1 Tax=Babylonia areolata TaxID=304850 RepID=UPI003FD47B03